MEEKKFVTFKKEELGVKEYVKRTLGKGRISDVSIEYTPVGEKIIIATSRPGLVIGRKGEKIDELTRVIKKRFHFDNPHIEIFEVHNPMLDAQLVADDIALALEREGSLKFKIIAYKMLQEIISSGASGAEIVLSGKLPSERARSWRFFQGYLKKTGDPAKVVRRAMSQAKTLPGVVGIKVSILPADAPIHDRIVINDYIKQQVSISPKEKQEESLASQSIQPSAESKPHKTKTSRKTKGETV